MILGKLTNSDNNKACEEAGEFLAGRGCDTKEQLRVKFGIEEVLMNYQKNFGTEADFAMETGYWLRKSRIRLTVPGISADPYSDPDAYSDEDVFIRNALDQMGRDLMTAESKDQKLYLQMQFHFLISMEYWISI